MLVSVLADVSQSYTELRAAQARLAIAKENLATTEELLDLTRQRRAAGLTTEIDVSNAIAQKTATRAELPAFDLEITRDINQLSRLLGREPEALRGPNWTVPLPCPCSRRPLDRSAGRTGAPSARYPGSGGQFACRHREIGVAVANLFPRLTLSRNGRFSVRNGRQFARNGPAALLVRTHPRSADFRPGRWKTVRLYDVRAQEAALAYQRTVLNALHEVENSPAAHGADQERRAWLDATVVQNRDTLILSRQRYESGVMTFIEVLEVERTLQQNELALADSIGAVSTDLVGLYRASAGAGSRLLNPTLREFVEPNRMRPCRSG